MSDAAEITHLANSMRVSIEDMSLNLDSKVSQFEEKTPDQVLDAYGPRNGYILFVWLSMASVWGVNAMPMMVSAFLMTGACPPDAQNCTPRNGSIGYEFDLSGKHAVYLDYMTTAFLIGITIGSGILPFRKGRRVVVLACLLLIGSFGIASALAPNILVFTVLRFLQSLFFTGCGVTNWVLAYESIPHVLRAYTALTFGLFWVAGYFLVGPLAYVLAEWRWLMVAVSAPALVAFSIFYWIIPESFHLTVSRRPQKDIIKWIQNGNYFAKDHTPEDATELCAALTRHRRRHSDALIDEVPQKALILYLCENRVLSLYTIIMAYLWTCDTFVYYGLSLYSSRLAGDEYVNFMLMALIEVPSYIVSPVLLDTLGRRAFVSICHFLAAISFFLVIFCENAALRLCIWLLGKFAISCSFTCLFVYASELFPTVARNGCIGICTVIACMGGVAAPLVQSMANIAATIPAVIFGVSVAIGGVVTLILPETRGIELPDTIDEMPNQTSTVVHNS